MPDPLRSLAELVRTLTRPRAEARANTAETQRPRAAGEQPPLADRPAVAASEALRERLRQRLRTVGTSDRRRAREAFVETVLASEFGDAVTLDPAMAEVVGKVARQIAEDPATDRDLGKLIDELGGESR